MKLEKFQFEKLENEALRSLQGGNQYCSTSGVGSTSSKKNDADSNAGDSDSSYTDSSSAGA